MAKLSAKTCEAAKPLTKVDRHFGDGDGLSLRIRPSGNKTWVIEYEFKGKRRKPAIGMYDREGASGESITAWLEDGRLSLAQARAIAAAWRTDRRAGRDPFAEWEASLAAKAAAAESTRQAAFLESQQPTLKEAFDLFLKKHIEGKESANAIRYRLDRLVRELGSKRIRDVTRQDIAAALDKIADGQREGGTAKQLAGEVLIQRSGAGAYPMRAGLMN